MINKNAILEELSKERKQLENTIKKANSLIKHLSPGKLRISSKYNGQYYLFDKEQNKWVYTSKANIQLIKETAQYEYEKKVLTEVQNQLKLINHFIKYYDPNVIENIQLNMSPSRLRLIKPHMITNEQFVASWLSEKYCTNSFPNENGYLTLNGDSVRSKSEAIIADRLFTMHIPYKYEHPYQLKDGTVYPDFTILDIRTRSEIIYEHFGRMDDPEYVNHSFMPKMKRYLQSGLVLGKNLICSFESSEHVLNVEVLKKQFELIFEENTYRY